MKILYLIPLFIVLSSCNQEKKVEVQPTEKISPEEAKKEIDQTVLLSNITKHKFSNPTVEDEFKLTITGKSILEGEMNFTITDAKGVQIFTNTLSSDYLIGFGSNDGGSMTNEEQVAYITKRVQDFFNEENFVKPVITKETKLEGASVNKLTWEEFKSEPKLIGFTYLLGKEDRRNIIFSRNREVVLNYN
ncbi:hypothetical protein [Flavobacterium sp. '19STA2R22 D10 B1']|uniref:hypothetical protein n=1 Tax=Flavobacterium aerium TaxID=3037261 RepID=UPI00278BFA82|nr:hypothetical protein [Flavobacterium sp. '19STA2R22 D10 B1']